MAHQYFIASQSGGLLGALSAPNAEVENPQKTPPSPDPTGDYTESDSDVDQMTTSGCDPSSGYQVKTVDMSSPLPSNTPWDNGPALSPPCEEYNTILDNIAARYGTPTLDDWQYIAYEDNTIWAAPLGVQHLYNQFEEGQANFVADPDAEQFVANIQSHNPNRPFANLTYITPCEHESDHPETSGSDDGPEWLAWVVNAIGQSQYWNSTAIIVTWDDWGGFFDHVPAVPNNPGPIRPNPNKYGTYPDPNEWGFRVPVIIISPYITARGFISSPATSGFTYRSQSVVQQFLEAIFQLPSLGGDDYQQGQNDGLADVFNFSPTPSPLPYVVVTDPPNWSPPSGGCPTNGGPSYRKHSRLHTKKSAGIRASGRPSTEMTRWVTTLRPAAQK